MKIGLVIDRLNPRLGGVEQWTCQFAEWLAGRGHEVHVVTRRVAGPAIELPIVRHELEASRRRLRFAEAAQRALRRLELDVVHDTGVGWHCDVLQPHGGARRASIEQNLLLKPSWMRPIKRRLDSLLRRGREFNELAARQYSAATHSARSAEAPIVVALSKMVARDLMWFHDVEPGRIRLVYNGVDAKRFSPSHRGRHREPVRQRLGISDGEVLLLVVAHNFALKGVPTLIRAVGRLRREGCAVRLVVAGGKRHAASKRLARRSRAEQHVAFVGAVDDPVPYFAAADVYVQPTFYDPCSLVVLEAMASGLPVVTSRFNGAGELLPEDEHEGLLDDPGDVEELCDRLRPLLDAEARLRSGKAARRVAEEHSLERNFREIVDIYDEKAATRRRAA